MKTMADLLVTGDLPVFRKIHVSCLSFSDSACYNIQNGIHKRRKTCAAD